MAKEVKMDNQKLDEKQLHEALNQISSQNQYLQEQLNAYKKTEFFALLDWNFKIVSSDSKYFSEQFKKDCAKRIEDMMTPESK
jgi:hypothetical protein